MNSYILSRNKIFQDGLELMVAYFKAKTEKLSLNLLPLEQVLKIQSKTQFPNIFKLVYKIV